jgi:hypothetical protein
MRRLGSLLLAGCLALGSLPSYAGQDDRPPGGSAGNQPPPAPTPAPTYTPPPAPTPTYVPPPAPTPPPNYGGSVSGSVTVNPPVYAPPPAQPAPYATMPGMYEVYVRDDAPGMVHRISFTDGRPIANCTGNCTFHVPPGQYVIEVDGNDTLRAGKKVVNVSGHTVVDVSPGSKSTRTAGLALGIAGPVALFVGLIGAVIVAADNNDKDFDCRTGYSTCDTSRSDATAYVLLMIAGAGATTAGWIMFGTASTKIRPSLGAPQTMPSVAMAAIPTRHGGAFGLTIHF